MASPLLQSPSPDTPEQAARRRAHQRKALWAALAVAAVLAALIWIYHAQIWDFTLRIWDLVRHKEAFRQRIEAYGVWAPLVFVVFQIFQVLISPIPGELVGAAGGYVFGWFPSLVYSTIGLSVGSWINFAVSRLLGRSFVERLIPPEFMARIAYHMERHVVIISFVFFVFPGFPKDYYCYMLGLSPMSWRVFAVISSVGRIPGTLLLSLQGAAVYQQDYWSFLWLGVLSIAFVAPVYIWRDKIYQWLYRLEKGRGPLDGDPEDKG